MNEKELKELKTALTLAVVVLVVYVGVKTYKQIADVFTDIFGDDKTDKLASSQLEKTRRLGYFSPTYNNGMPKGGLLIKNADASIQAKKIKDAIGTLYDTPEQIESVFSKYRTKSQVSQIALKFADLYKLDLLGFLESKLDTDSQQTVLVRILARLDTLPAFFPLGGIVAPKLQTPIIPKKISIPLNKTTPRITIGLGEKF